MDEIALKERIDRLQKEMRIAGEASDRQIIELRADLDRARLELEALKNFLGDALPSFKEEYPRILNRTIEEVDPEFKP